MSFRVQILADELLSSDPFYGAVTDIVICLQRQNYYIIR